MAAEMIDDYFSLCPTFGRLHRRAPNAINSAISFNSTNKLNSHCRAMGATRIEKLGDGLTLASTFNRTSLSESCKYTPQNFLCFPFPFYFSSFFYFIPFSHVCSGLPNSAMGFVGAL